MDEWKESYHGVFGWSVSDDGRCVPPAQHLPECVIERLKWPDRERCVKCGMVRTIGRYANVLAAQAVADHYHNGEVVVFDD